MRQNFSASFIVFLVALPLCLGIALASGVSPEKGVISGVIGGIVVGALGGAPLQVSGPANSLIVIVAEAVKDIGLEGLGLAVCLAGALQIFAGGVGAGRLAKLFPPIVTKGLMTGFAILIFASQAHVMLDARPHASFMENIRTIPEVFVDKMGFSGSSTIPWGPLIGIGSFVFLLGMQGFQSRISGVLKKIPPALIVVAVATLIATVWNLPLKRVHVPDQLMDDFSFPSLSQWMGSINFLILEVALTIFFLASTESLLSASAIDQMKEGHTTNYSRELMAQGIGNILCGLVGAVPIAGVVIRSTANIASGATTRASSIFHGVWLLAMVGIFPFILDDVPMSILGAILVFSVLKLINLGQINEMAKSDRWAWPMYLGTAVAVLTFNPMVGVGIGIGLQCAKSVYTSLNLGKVIASHEEINIPARVDQSGD